MRAIRPGEDVHLALRPGERRLRQDQPERRQARAIEAAVHERQRPEAAQQQPGADDEHHRERDFRHHQRVAGARARGADGRAGAAFVERAVHRLLAQVQQRREPEQEAGRERGDEREGEDPPVERDVRGPRHAVGIRARAAR